MTSVDMTDMDHMDQYGPYELIWVIWPFHESEISTCLIYILFYSTIDVSLDLFQETPSNYFYRYWYKNYSTLHKNYIVLCS